MHRSLLHVYQRLPAPVRSWVATVRGRRLNAWRYGPETEGLVAEARARERWSPGEWSVWREERLARLLHRAATRVPWYREHWAERRRRGDRSSWEVLAHWPVLGKEPLRAQPRAFVADDRDPRRMFHAHTSGTSGKPLSLWWGRGTLHRWYALLDLRLRGWNGVSRHDPYAMLGGQLVAGFEQRRPPFWVWNAAMNQLYMSSYHLRPDAAAAYLDAMREHRVRYALGYSSSFFALALAALERGLAPPELAVVMTNAEPLTTVQRERIGHAFRCPVRETYGMTEMACGASECESGRLHLWPDAGVLEVLADDGDEPAPAGTVGRFVSTGLLDEDMPLIRYQVGDRGAVAADAACACGRTLPVLAGIEGRQDDVVLTRDGRRIGRLDPAFKSDLPIREAQVVQETLDRLRVRLVPAAGWGPRHEADLAARLRERVGDMEIVFESVAEIPRSANGKFRAVVSMLR